MSAAPFIVNEVKLNQPIEAAEPRLRGTSRPRPTPAELLVITLRAAGRSLKEIAIELNLALATVETHMSNIYRKMGWTSIVDLVHFALAHRLVENKYAPPKKKGRVEEFFEHNLGRKYLASDLIPPLWPVGGGNYLGDQPERLGQGDRLASGTRTRRGAVLLGDRAVNRKSYEPLRPRLHPQPTTPVLQGRPQAVSAVD
jgi:DNA-binding CsgD family transcriptional regulator